MLLICNVFRLDFMTFLSNPHYTGGIVRRTTEVRRHPENQPRSKDRTYE